MGCTLNQRGLSENNHSENALLRSRIDEQSDLIMILKRRSDEAMQTVNLLDKRNKLLVAECEKAREDLAVQTNRCRLLKSRFDDLAYNHQQMIEVSPFQVLLCNVPLCACRGSFTLPNSTELGCDEHF